MCKTVLFMLVCGLSAQAGFSKLEAISMIESGNNDWAVGKAGEISRFQIKPEVWRKYTNSRAYADPALARWVAQQHLAALEKYFKTQTGREPTDFDRYVMWNGGISYYARIGFHAPKVKPVIQERAKRYVNLRERQEDGTAPAKNSLFALGVPNPRGM